MVEVRTVNATEGRQYIGTLARVLIDCVESGASVSFMSPLSIEKAESFFEKVFDGIERNERILLAAFEGDELLGTVQIVTAMPENQPHRADIAKLLVHRSARNKGIGEQLMTRAEEVAKLAGKTLLVLDTVTGAAGERLYERLGWTKAGVVPNYARLPDGTPCSTTIFWKAV